MCISLDESVLASVPVLPSAQRRPEPLRVFQLSRMLGSIARCRPGAGEERPKMGN